MSNEVSQYRDFAPFTAAEAGRRIEDWFRRGFIMFSDVVTRSTHLQPVPIQRHAPEWRPR